MLITFLVPMLALIIAVVCCAVLHPTYHGGEDEGTADWESSI